MARRSFLAGEVLTAYSKPCSNSPMEESPDGISIMFAAERPDCTESAVRQVLADLAEPCGSITVAAVADRLHPIALWAPMMGAPLADLRGGLLVEAGAHAERTAGGCGAGVAVITHVGVPSWRGVSRMLRSDAYDVLAMKASAGRSPSRRAVAGEARRRGVRVLWL